MRKGFAGAGILALALLALALVLSRRPEQAERGARPELVRVGQTQVALAWRTRALSQGSVRYRPGAIDAEALIAAEPPPPVQRHELAIQGLEPGTRYRYWLAGGDLAYHFETQPLSTTPFSFLLVWGDVSSRLASLASSETPGFVLSLTPIPAGDADPYRALRPYLPVYGPSGPSSTVVEQLPSSSWALDWGGLRLVLLDDGAELARLVGEGAPHTVGIIAKRGGLDPTGAGLPPLSATVERHNRELPSRAVAFVIVPGERGPAVESAGVVYLPVPFAPPGKASSGTMRFDVGPESTVARFLDSGEEVTLRRPKLKRWRSCKECRQLADRGAYEQSVRAYQEFIQNNQGHFQVDDAHYAIAEILDEHLFRYEEALGWYKKLADLYPDSTLVPLARQRIQFLTAHADHGFEPLVRFERARKVELARQRASPAGRRRVVEQVAGILAEFPDATLAPEIRYWLANQYRSVDPDRAVALYRELLAKHPGYGGAEDAWIEIGETYYEARRHKDAIAAWREARVALPARAAGIEMQIDRARRNVRRGILAWAAWIALALVAAAGAVLPPAGLSARACRRATAAFLPLAALTLLGGGLVREQFSRVRELVGLGLAIPASACFGFPFASGLAQKLLCRGGAGERAGRRALAVMGGIVLGLLVLVAGAFLAVFYLNEHYLNGLRL
ncbi:MAG: tetratricopeptide repeat protein [Deltaproteobacteria bacterium]|nr:tetratricopeptide repeat protein [Deltaproteobacteria bacterium]